MKRAGISRPFFACGCHGRANALKNNKLLFQKVVNPMSDIFREVDEALQREKASKFWKQYGPTLVLAAIVLVLATAATTGYRTWDTWRDKQETSKLVNAAEEKDTAAAMEKAAAGTRDGHKVVALLNAAGMHAGKKDFAKAADLYGQAASDGSAPQDLRDLANILYSRSALLAAGDRAPDYKTQIEKLLPIAKNNNSAFQLQAKLDAALLYGDGLKDYTAALDLLKSFEAKDGQDSLSEKATALKHVYEYEVSKAPAKTSSQQK